MAEQEGSSGPSWLTAAGVAVIGTLLLAYADYRFKWLKHLDQKVEFWAALFIVFMILLTASFWLIKTYLRYKYSG